MTPFTPPEYNKDAFNCPFCGAYAKQNWADVHGHNTWKEDIRFSNCSHCYMDTIWRCINGNWQTIDPFCGTAPLPNSDLPPDILADYEEARSIAGISPRSAAALLRLAIEKLCKHLGENGTSINEDIKNLVNKGLPEQVQKALDIVRVVGNNAVHPGKLDLLDDSETVSKLFGLVNLIAEIMIAQPKHINELYDGLPDKELEKIAKRDKTH
ncbi:MAG: DUF4145 domain-containing protein [Armatimonadota bacterium]